jgi:hypothetical protein
MLGKFKDKGWIKPLAAHCGVQALFTFVIAATALGWDKDVGLYVLGLALLDFTIHFIMDRIKASPKMLGRYESLSKEQFKGLMECRSLAVQGIDYKDSVPLMAESLRLVKEIDAKFKGNKYFWWALGFDQMVHHLTDILIIFLIMRAI